MVWLATHRIPVTFARAEHIGLHAGRPYSPSQTVDRLGRHFQRRPKTDPLFLNSVDRQDSFAFDP